MKDNNKLFGSLKRLKINKESSTDINENIENSTEQNDLFDEEDSFKDKVFESEENEENEENDEYDDIMDIINEDIPVSENSNKEYIEREDALKDDETLIEQDIEEKENHDEINEDVENLLFSDETENELETLTTETYENDLNSEFETETISEEEQPVQDENNPESSGPYIDSSFSLDETQEIETEEPFKEDITENDSNENEIVEPFENSSDFEEDNENPEPPEFIYSEESEMDEVYTGYYNENEISSKRTKVKKKGKDLALKIIIALVMMGIFVGIAIGVRYLLNNKDKLIPKEEVEISETIETPTEVPEITDIPTTTPEELENEHPGLDVSNDIKDIEEDVPQKEEVSSFIQTFTGYVVDINNTDIYVSDKIEDEQLGLLKDDFDSYMTGTDTTVYINDTNSNETEETSESTESTESTDIIIIGASSNTTESEEKTTEKIYHANSTCEFSMNVALSPVKLSSLNEEYVMCESCGSQISLSNNTVLDYDYSEIPELASIIYKKFNIDAETIPDWTTIGSKVTISYMQNADTYLNDIIEISRAKTNTDLETDFTVDENGNVVEVDNEDDYRLSETNIFGSEFEAIVAKINDRNKGKEKFTGNVLDEELSLVANGTRESVSSSISIGSCDYVWIQIVWKKNEDTKSIPDVEDVTVELQTPGGSLVNDSNLNMYGTKWINKKVINYVLKNPKVGNWKVLFTKDIGTYLGDVTIQAAPMTGFLRIDKAAAKYTDGKLKCIWQATGISDDYCKVQIYARNGNNDILLYSGNTIDDDVRTVDMVDIDTAKIAGNIYDIVIKITDIDVSSSNPKKITYQFITDEYIIENIEIPSIR